MELRQIRYFVAVAEELHFGRAARRLGLSQPPLSQQIKGLEHDLGASLFNRSRRHVALTKAGEMFLPEAYKLLEQSNRAFKTLKRVNDGETGQLYLGAVPTAFYEILPSILLPFKESHPEIGVSLRECDTAQGEAALLDGSLDCAFIRLSEPRLPLAQQALQSQAVLVALPNDHPLTRIKKLNLEDLATESFITLARNVSPSYYDSVNLAFFTAGFQPRTVHECNSLHSKLGFVASGLGLALVPDAVSRLGICGVTYRQLSEKIPLIDISLAWNTERISASVSAFLSAIKNLQPKASTTQ